MKICRFIILPSTIWLAGFLSLCTALNPEVDDPKWPGSKPADGTKSAISINIQFDESPDISWDLEQFVQGVATDPTNLNKQATAPQWIPVQSQDFSGASEMAGLHRNITVANLQSNTQYRFRVSDSGVNNTGWVTLMKEDGLLWSIEGDVLENNTMVASLFVDGNGTVRLTTMDLFGTSYPISTTKSIDLYGAGLSGTIPTAFGWMTALTYLNLGDNAFTGGIPTLLGRLTSLTALGLPRNQLTGMIPSELGKLTRLAGLGLFDNQLTGMIPTELGMLTDMTSLALSDNQLTGMVPAALRTESLISLYLQENDLSGNIPSSLCGLPSLYRLAVDCDEVTCFCSAQCVCDY